MEIFNDDAQLIIFLNNKFEYFSKGLINIKDK